MGSGDLNLLKSWNPHLLKNKKKVWETEQQLLTENRKIKERQQEIAKEKELEELTSLNRDGTSSKKKTGLEWMYDDVAAQDTGNDDFLLGKKELNSTVLNKNGMEKNPESTRKRFDNSAKGIDAVIKKNEQSHRSDLSRDDPMLKLQIARKQKSQALQKTRFGSPLQRGKLPSSTNKKYPQSVGKPPISTERHSMVRNVNHHKNKSASQKIDIDY